MNKIELIKYALGQIELIKKYENVDLDMNKVQELVNLWVDENEGCSRKDVDIFFERICDIAEAEIEIRKMDSSIKKIWLIK